MILGDPGIVSWLKTMAMFLISFKYSIDTEVIKTKVDALLNWLIWILEAGPNSTKQDEEDGWFIVLRQRENKWRLKLLTALFVVIPITYMSKYVTWYIHRKGVQKLSWDNQSYTAILA